MKIDYNVRPASIEDYNTQDHRKYLSYYITNYYNIEQSEWCKTFKKFRELRAKYGYENKKVQDIEKEYLKKWNEYCKQVDYDLANPHYTTKYCVYGSLVNLFKKPELFYFNTLEQAQVVFDTVKNYEKGCFYLIKATLNNGKFYAVEDIIDINKALKDKVEKERIKKDLEPTLLLHMIERSPITFLTLANELELYTLTTTTGTSYTYLSILQGWKKAGFYTVKEGSILAEGKIYKKDKELARKYYNKLLTKMYDKCSNV